MLKERAWVSISIFNSILYFFNIYIYISGDGYKVESHLLVLMDFWDKVYRPKLVKFYSVLHEKQRETFCYVLHGSELLWEYLLSREMKII